MPPCDRPPATPLPKPQPPRRPRQPRPGPPQRSDQHSVSQYDHNQLIKISLIITACVIGLSLMAGIVLAIVRKYHSRRNNARRRNSATVFETQEEFFLDEDHGPVIDHPIWYINTVGLQQSVIDSITVCTYKKDEGLIDGTECSVCLSEFEEDETLRLLPKCSHAFHLTCIDTWLRSHKNCPMCRAPIVSNAAGSPASISVPSTSASSSSQETQVQNHEDYNGVESNQVGEGGSSEVGVGDEGFEALAIEDGRDAEISNKSLQNSTSGNRHSRVQLNLADNQRVLDIEIQPMRRSVSLDSPSAARIYDAVANVVTDQRSSKSQLVVAKPDSGTSSTCKLVKSSSIGRSLQKGPVSMKKSFSSGRKFLSSRPWRSGSSILPL